MEKQFKDVVDNLIEIGDTVVTNHTKYKYQLLVCTVSGFTEQQIRLIPVCGQFSTGTSSTTRYPSQCAVVKKGK